MSGFSGSDSVFDSFFGPDQPSRTAPRPSALPAIRGKRIDDVLYVSAEDVADALAQLGPETNKRLIDKLRGAL